MSKFAHRRTWGPLPTYPNVKKYSPPNDKFIVIAGPCSVESETQIQDIAGFVAEHGATHLRGGVFRAGTYPGKTFGFVHENLIAAYSDAAKANNLKCIIEVLDYSTDAMELILEYADCLQVGCRQMQNYMLLHALRGLNMPIFLKRHPGSTIDEWLGACEHLLNSDTLCEPHLIERGSSTHATHVRWDLSISMIPAVKTLSQVPVICDASHGTGRRDLVMPMTLAGVAAGANGILVETHHDPDKSLSDADQAISLSSFATLMAQVKELRLLLQTFVTKEGSLEH